VGDENGLFYSGAEVGQSSVYGSRVGWSGSTWEARQPRGIYNIISRGRDGVFRAGNGQPRGSCNMIGVCRATQLPNIL
jgi:hypothetical protein